MNEKDNFSVEAKSFVALGKSTDNLVSFLCFVVDGFGFVYRPKPKLQLQYGNILITSETAYAVGIRSTPFSLIVEESKKASATLKTGILNYLSWSYNPTNHRCLPSCWRVLDIC